MSSGTESGIFWNTGGGSNRDLFSLELKLDEQYDSGRGHWWQNVGGQSHCLTSKLYLAEFWRNSDLVFSQKVNAQNGASHSGLQKS